MVTKGCAAVRGLLTRACRTHVRTTGSLLLPDFFRVSYVLYGVKYIGLVSLAWFTDPCLQNPRAYHRQSFLFCSGSRCRKGHSSPFSHSPVVLQYMKNKKTRKINKSVWRGRILTSSRKKKTRGFLAPNFYTNILKNKPNMWVPKNLWSELLKILPLQTENGICTSL